VQSREPCRPDAAHVVELLQSGRTGSGQQAISVLGLPAPRPTQQVLTELYEWADIVSLTPNRSAA